MANTCPAVLTAVLKADRRSNVRYRTLDVLDVLGRVLLHRLRLTAGRGVGQGIVVTVSRTALW